MALDADSGNISGVEKAAMFLLVMGEDEAANVLKNMSIEEVESVGKAMANISNVSKSEAWAILEHFDDSCLDKTSLGMNMDSYISSVFNQALGSDKANTVIGNVIDEPKQQSLEQLQWLSSEAITSIVRDENPQLIAITLASVSSEKASDILSALDVGVQKEVVKRIALLDKIEKSAFDELEQVIRQGVIQKPEPKVTDINGAKALANIINNMDETEDDLLEEVAKLDSTLAELVRDMMFVFDNVATLADKDLQRCMRDVSAEVLTLSLKGASAEVTAKIFKNMSSRAAEIIREDLESRGPIKISEVEQAQKDFLVVVRQLAESGEISLGQNTKDYI